MPRIAAILVFLLLATTCQAQDGYKTKFGVGLTLGLNTSVGMGAKVIYTPWRFLHIDGGFGKTAFNGFKYSAGFRFYPLKEKTFNPYVGGYFSRSTGQLVRSQNGLSSEKYRTFANQYVHPHIGGTIYGGQMNHTFALGYSLLLGNYSIDVDTANKTNENQAKIENKLKGGIMATYTIWIHFTRRR